MIETYQRIYTYEHARWILWNVVFLAAFTEITTETPNDKCLVSVPFSFGFEKNHRNQPILRWNTDELTEGVCTTVVGSQAYPAHHTHTHYGTYKYSIDTTAALVRVRVGWGGLYFFGVFVFENFFIFYFEQTPYILVVAVGKRCLPPDGKQTSCLPNHISIPGISYASLQSLFQKKDHCSRQSFWSHWLRHQLHAFVNRENASETNTTDNTPPTWTYQFSRHLFWRKVNVGDNAKHSHSDRCQPLTGRKVRSTKRSFTG